MVKVNVLMYLKLAIKIMPDGPKSEVLKYAIAEMDRSELLIETERSAAIEEMKERLSRFKFEE